MKIVHVVRGDFNPNSLNGVYKVIDSISKALTVLGGNVEVCSVAKDDKSEIYKPDIYKHIRVKEHRLKFFITNNLKKYLLSHNKDTIFHFHSVFIPWFLPSVSLLKGQGYRVVLTPHGQYVDEAMKKSFKKQLFFHFFDKKIIRMVDGVQCIGKTEINSYIKRNTKKYIVIPNGCSSLLQNMDTSKRILIFGYMGRLQIDQKGLDTMIFAFYNYIKKGGKGILKIVGDGKDKKVIERLVSELGLVDRVFLEGVMYDNDKWTFLKNCAFFLHPSRWDVIPTASMEAATCFVPLIVTRATNLDTYVEHYNSGFVVEDYHSEDSLLDALFNAENLFFNKNEYTKTCQHSADMIVNELNWTSIANKNIKQLYS